MPKPRAYQFVAAELRNRVRNGTYPPESRMPSLREVESEFTVSRATSHAAYQLLISEGLVRGLFGGGYYVRRYQPIIRHGIQRLASNPLTADVSIWAADPGTAGSDLAVTDLQVLAELPPDDVARDLRLTTEANVLVRRRRYILDGKPVLLATSYFPADLASGTLIEHPDTGPGGAYARLTDAGEPPTWFQEDISARMPTPTERVHLDLSPGTPVFTIRRTVWGPTGRPLEVNRMTADAASYVLRYVWPTQNELPTPERFRSTPR